VFACACMRLRTWLHDYEPVEPWDVRSLNIDKKMGVFIKYTALWHTSTLTHVPSLPSPFLSINLIIYAVCLIEMAMLQYCARSSPLCFFATTIQPLP
jgi:hypothetical protein